MTKRTVANRLESHHLKVQAEQKGRSWYDNPRELPLPTLPEQSILEGDYLTEIARSQPQILPRIVQLIDEVGQVREGKISYHGRR